VGRHYRFVSLDELGRRLEEGAASSEPVAAVTFDDGYATVYHHALPLLKRKGIPAGVFVITEAMGRAALQLYDKLYLLAERVLPVLGHSEERLRHVLGTRGVQPQPVDGHVLRDGFRTMRWLFTTLTQQQLSRAIDALQTVVPIDECDYPDLHSLSWDMAREMADAGFTIGSHTGTHALLTEESPEQVAVQTEGSLLSLRTHLQRPVEHFAYPDGRCNAAVVAAVARAGYRFGYGTCLHRDARYPQLTIPRTLLWERSSLDLAGRFSPSVMSCHARHVFDLWSSCSHDHRDVPAHGAARAEPVAAQAPAQSARCESGVPDQINV
jgi:peptidoglycan/xylan/chitin deacetylase (PgdA/CDA1 family)